jgi:hypothetical protein
VQPVIPLGTVGQLQGVAGRWWASSTAWARSPLATTSTLAGRIPALQRQSGLQLPGGRRRRLEPGQAGHRRARAGAATARARPTWAAPTQQYSYEAETTYVAGEFYWQVQRGQKTFNRDFASGKQPAVDGADAATRSPGPPAPSSTATRWPRPSSWTTRKTCSSARPRRPSAAARSIGIIPVILMVVIVILIVLSLLSRCSRCDPQARTAPPPGSRSSGGSYGG